MRNYGEELVYWYFRLNGFFPIVDYVLHKWEDMTEINCLDDEQLKYSSDIDIIAIRHPYVYENIGGQKNDWDKELVQKIDILNKTVGIICEVKTGKSFVLKPDNEKKKIDYAVKRLGLINNKESTEIVKKLSNEKMVDIDEDIRVVKVLISKYIDSKYEDKYVCLELKHIIRFIKKRMQKYIDRKEADRMFFPSALLQYIITEEERLKSKKVL